MTENDDLRKLFTDATADIRPQGTYDDIRSRTEKVDPMARRWFLPAMAAAAVMALVIGTAFWLNRDDGAPAATPAGSPTSTATATSSPLTTAVEVYYLGESTAGPRLFAEKTTVQADDGSPEALAIAAGDAALAGKPLDLDYRSVWPTGTFIAGFGVADGVITVTLPDGLPTDRPAGMSREEARLSVEQLVHSVISGYGQALPVSFTATPASEGASSLPITSLLGIDTSHPYSPLADIDVMAPVQITNLVDHQKVAPGKLTVSGVAATFEANVVWEILVGGDAVIDSGFTTAAEGGVLSPYTFETNIPLEAGTYTLRVHDSDESGEGRAVNQDSKEIIVE